MIVSLFIRYVERIPLIKDLVKKLRNVIAFKLNCDFIVSVSLPSEASYSRLVDKLEMPYVLEQVQEQALEQTEIEADRLLYDKKIGAQLQQQAPYLNCIVR